MIRRRASRSAPGRRSRRPRSPARPPSCAASPERTDRLVQQISVSVHVRSLGDNPLKDNPTFGGNAVSVDLQSAKRTTNDEYVLKARVVGDATFTITDDATTVTGDVLDVLDVVSHVIEPGFFKVVVDTDWRSFDTVTFDL